MNNRKLITFTRIVRGGGQGFVRNASLSIAAVAVMVITLTIVLFSLIANATFANTVKQITDKIDISVYLKDDVSIDRRNQLISDIQNIKNVKSVEFVSKDQALEAYKKANATNTDLLTAISQTDNPLPASLQIKPKDPNKIQEIKNYLEQADIKKLQSDQTSYSGDRKEAIDKIAGATRFFRQAGFVSVIIFTLVSMLIIFNTIRMTIFNRRDELQIMRLLGASTAFIRGPFVVETILYGIVSALLSVAICHSLFSLTSNTFQASSLGLLDIGYASQYFANHFWLILTVQLAIGMLIGAVSSLIATRRYLKFKTSK
jgi:cell division transport system permease protein